MTVSIACVQGVNSSHAARRRSPKPASSLTALAMDDPGQPSLTATVRSPLNTAFTAIIDWTVLAPDSRSGSAALSLTDCTRCSQLEELHKEPI